MSTYSKVKFTNSTDGRNIKIAAIAATGTVIHTGHASALDEVWIWATNTDTSTRKLTIEWGETTSPDGSIEIFIAPESGPQLIIPGWLITNSLLIRAFAATSNVINVNGFVNRIT